MIKISKDNSFKLLIFSSLLIGGIYIKNSFNEEFADESKDNETTFSFRDEMINKFDQDIENLIEQMDETEEKEIGAVKPYNLVHDVESGDSLSLLSKKYGIDIDYIKKNNPNKNLNILIIGEKIDIPSENGFFYKVSKGETLSKISEDHKIFLTDIVKGDESEVLYEGETIFLKNPTIPLISKNIIVKGPTKSQNTKNQKTIFSNLFRNPLNKMTLTSAFGSRKHPVTNLVADHGGLDLRAKIGTKVFAANGGTVKFAGRSGNYGNLIIVTHPNGFETRYAHLSKIAVKKGEKILPNQQIALSGATGRVTGPHLHFEVRRNGAILNPMNHLIAFKK